MKGLQAARPSFPRMRESGAHVIAQRKPRDSHPRGKDGADERPLFGHDAGAWTLLEDGTGEWWLLEDDAGERRPSADDAGGWWLFKDGDGEWWLLKDGEGGREDPAADGERRLR